MAFISINQLKFVKFSIHSLENFKSGNLQTFKTGGGLLQFDWPVEIKANSEVNCQKLSLVATARHVALELNNIPSVKF